jgi:hypothetical protein
MPIKNDFSGYLRVEIALSLALATASLASEAVSPAALSPSSPRAAKRRDPAAVFLHCVSLIVSPGWTKSSTLFSGEN